MGIRVKDIVEVLAVDSMGGPADAEIRGLAYDSHQVHDGYLFAALPGARSNGWTYVADAIARGATCVLHEEGEPFDPNVTFIRVSNARAALAAAACVFHGRPAEHLATIGITGTNGKTTIAYLVDFLLKKAGRVPGLLGTVAYRIGPREIPAARTTPESVDLQALLAEMVAADCTVAIMEVSSHAIVQNRIGGIDYDIGVFANLSGDHLDYHGTMENYFDAKSTFMRGLRGGETVATAVVNIDDSWGRRLAESGTLAADLVTFGMDADAAVRATDLQLGHDGNRYHVRSAWGEADVRSSLLGRFNVSNELAALTVGATMGLDLQAMAGWLHAMPQVPGRLESVPLDAGYQVFVDYAHTGDALRKVLETIREIAAARIILVFGCGGERDRGKRPEMGRAACALADHTILTSDNPRGEDPAQIIHDIVSGFDAGCCYEVIEDRRAAIQNALAMAADGDIVLVAGKGHEGVQELANTVLPFDDHGVINELVNQDA